MARPIAWVLLSGVLPTSALLTACVGGASAPGSSVSRAPSGSPSVVENLDPHGELSNDPATLAADLAATTLRLRAAVRAWTDTESAPPTNVQLLALHQQRIYGQLSSTPSLARRTLPLLSGRLAAEARTNVEAGAALRSGVKPIKGHTSFRTGPPDPAADLRGDYNEADARFGVAWQVLAAVNFIETRFGRVRSSSYAGARGPMQFIPSTWKAYGMGGDVRNARDAILGAANFLSASGAPGDYRQALYHYNPSNSYVKAVWLYARQMMRDPKYFLIYYNWQVFVVTTKGDQQVTGPGANAGA